MPWFKVDDRLHAHPKAQDVVDSRPSAMGLWALAGSWCAAMLTDGLVPKRQVSRLGFKPADARALVDCGLWHEAEGGYQFHDWQEYQPTREQVEGERTAARERMRRKRSGEHPSNRSGEQTQNFAVGSLTPSRPVPTRPVEEDGDGGGCVNGISLSAVSLAWHKAAQVAGSTAVHALDGWRSDYATIAGAVAGEASRHGVDSRKVLCAVMAWFWLAPDGPVQAGRSKRPKPSTLSKLISDDIERAAEWSGTPAGVEAVQAVAT